MRWRKIAFTSRQQPYVWPPGPWWQVAPNKFIAWFPIDHRISIYWDDVNVFTILVSSSDRIIFTKSEPKPIDWDEETCTWRAPVKKEEETCAQCAPVGDRSCIDCGIDCDTASRCSDCAIAVGLEQLGSILSGFSRSLTTFAQEIQTSADRIRQLEQLVEEHMPRPFDEENSE